MPPHHRHEVDENLTRLHNGQVLIHEVVNQRKDGSPVTMKLRERAVVLDNGERRIIVNAEDVSAQRQAEHYMRLQITALESSVNGIMIVDREGRITWVNKAFTELTGYTAEEVVGQSPRLLKSGRHDQHFYQTLWNTVLDGRMWRGDMVNRRKDGTLYLEELTITPVLDAQGLATHFVGIKQDITERRNLQQQLYQAQKMEGIGRLAGGIAHDFNNLLQAITGFCTLLLEQMSPESPYRPDVLEIEKAAQRAAALTRQLLAFSRRQMMETKPVNLNRLVENLQKMLQRLLGEDVNLMTDLAPNLDRVRVDPGQIEQVLLNLAINARDAMPQGGRLTISTYSLVFLKEDTLLVPEARHGRFVCLAMSDTGIGMSREVIDHIFEPFYSTKGPGKGTGLGLSVVYGIVRQHDGMVHVYSQLGEGTTFRIYLPVYSETAEEQPDTDIATPVTRNPAPGVRILLTEDEDGVRDFAVRALRNHGYQVSTVATAQGAIDLFKAEQGQFDLLFTDVVLPDLNGLDMARILVREKPTLRLLFTSGYMDDKSRWPAIRDHGYRFLQKPYPVQDLLRAIQETLSEPAREQTLD
jgi:PAS domain S-box-containing protein